MTPVTPNVRFDDVREQRSQVLVDFSEELRADTLDEVVSVLERAEDAARRGWWVAGYLAYESAPAFDEGLRVRDRDPASALPYAWFGIFRGCVRTRFALPRASSPSKSGGWASLVGQEEYVKSVAEILDEIHVGTVYQVNHTTSFVNRTPVDPLSLYRQLLLAQRPSYGSLIEFDDVAIVSASPELFIEWDGARLRSRPMKGTSRRGRYRQEDAQFATSLTSSPKERAENVMIVDLIRNDMGKIAELGTVDVPELLSLEAYPNVWQLVSEVQCTTRTEVRAVDIFRAMFPCGSVTGAPKQSAMEIIARLETSERGAYCGAIGVFEPSSPGLRARFNVAIRTAVLDRGRGARYGSGGGVVAESHADAEYGEMVLKADMLNRTPRPFRLLETFRYTPGSANENIARHLDRLKSSADFFGFRVRPTLERRIEAKLASLTFDARVRVLLSRNGELEVQSFPAPPHDKDALRLVIDDVPVFSGDVMLFHKTTQRGAYTTRKKKYPDVDDVVLVNERGECTESTVANLVVRIGDQWCTPPLSSGCLPGVERARLLEEGAVVEAVLYPEDLYVGSPNSRSSILYGGGEPPRSSGTD